MKRTKPMLAASLVAGGLAITAALAQDSTAGTNEWVAPARAAKKKSPIPAAAPSLERGKALYVKECASCHGDKGKGDGPAAKDLEKHPGDLTAAKMWDQTDGAFFWKLTEGRKPMPSYAQTISEEDRWHVINYMRTLSPKPSK